MNLREEHYKIIDQRRASHLNGESKSYSWEEVKHNVKSAKQKETTWQIVKKQLLKMMKLSVTFQRNTKRS